MVRSEIEFIHGMIIIWPLYLFQDLLRGIFHHLQLVGKVLADSNILIEGDLMSHPREAVIKPVCHEDPYITYSSNHIILTRCTHSRISYVQSLHARGRFPKVLSPRMLAAKIQANTFSIRSNLYFLTAGDVYYDPLSFFGAFMSGADYDPLSTDADSSLLLLFPYYFFLTLVSSIFPWNIM